MRKVRRLMMAVRSLSASVTAEGGVPGRLDVRAETDCKGAPLPGFETQGYVRETPSGFESSGSLNIEKEGPEERHEVFLCDTAEDRMDITGRHLVPAGTEVAALLSSVEGIRGFVEASLGCVSERLCDAFEGVSSHTAETVTHEQKDFLDAGYTISVRDQTEMRIEGGEVALSRGDGLAFSWELDVRNHGKFLAGLIEKDDKEGYVDVRTLFEARRLSGFSEALMWEAGLSGGEAVAEVEYESQNGPGYTERLRKSGIGTPEDARFGYNTDPTEAPIDWLCGLSVFLPLPVLFVLVRFLHPADGF